MPPVGRRIESRSPSNSGGATQKRKQRLTGAFAAAKGKSAREAFRVASTEVKSTGMSDAPTVQEQLDAFETRLRTAESEVKTSEVKIDALETRNAVLEEQLRKFMRKEAYVLPDAPDFDQVLAEAQTLRNLTTVEMEHLERKVQRISEENSSKRRAGICKLLELDEDNFDGKVNWLEKSATKQWQLYYLAMFGKLIDGDQEEARRRLAITSSQGAPLAAKRYRPEPQKSWAKKAKTSGAGPSGVALASVRSEDTIDGPSDSE